MVPMSFKPGFIRNTQRNFSLSSSGPQSQSAPPNPRGGLNPVLPGLPGVLLRVAPFFSVRCPASSGAGVPAPLLSRPRLVGPGLLDAAAAGKAASGPCPGRVRKKSKICGGSAAARFRAGCPDRGPARRRRRPRRRERGSAAFDPAHPRGQVPSPWPVLATPLACLAPSVKSIDPTPPRDATMRQIACKAVGRQPLQIAMPLVTMGRPADTNACAQNPVPRFQPAMANLNYRRICSGKRFL